MLTKQYGKLLLVLMLSIAVVPVVSAASAQSQQPMLDASGKIAVAISGIPVTDIIPAFPDPDAVLAVDTYHFTKFKASGVNYGSFDLVVVYAMSPLFGHVPLAAFTDNAYVQPLLNLVFLNPFFSVSGVEVGDLDVAIMGMSIKQASAEGSFDSFGSLTYTPIPKVKGDSITMPAGLIPSGIPGIPGIPIEIEFGKGRPVTATGTINGQGFTGTGFVSIFKMYTL